MMKIRTGALLVVVALCGMVYFALYGYEPRHVQESPGEKSDSAVPARAQDASASPPALGRQKFDTAARSRLAQGDNGKLFGLDAHAMARSHDPAMIDYATLRLELPCRFAARDSLGPAARVAAHMAQESADPQLVKMALPGNSTHEQRTRALVALKKRCETYYGSTIGLSVEETDFAVREPKYREMVRFVSGALMQTEQHSEAEVQRAMRTLIETPLFTEAAAAVHQHVDLAKLLTSEGVTRGEVLDESFKYFVSELVACRMGDDCGADGWVTSAMCWQAGYCASTAEEAIYTRFKGTHIDSSTLGRIVDRIVSGFANGDTSILLKKPRPVK